MDGLLGVQLIFVTILSLIYFISVFNSESRTDGFGKLFFKFLFSLSFSWVLVITNTGAIYTLGSDIGSEFLLWLDLFMALFIVIGLHMY